MLLTSASELFPEGRLMALDQGSKTIGVAVTDAERRLVQPLETITRKKFNHDVERLQSFIRDYQPVALVVGYPLNMDGSEGERCQSVRAFVRNLEQACPLPILMWDERLSTQAANDMMEAAEIRTSLKHEKRDAIAAAMILESLLKHL